MRIGKNVQYLLASCLLLGMPAQADLDTPIGSGDFSEQVPVVYTDKDCLHKTLNVPEDIREKGYTYLKNANCSMYFVAPPAISKQRVTVTPHGGLDSCGAYDSVQEIQNAIEKRKRNLNDIMSDLEIRLFSDISEAEERRIEKKISRLEERLAGLNKESQANIDYIYDNYNDIKGVTYTIQLANQVNDADLFELERMNSITYHNPNHASNGLPEYVKAPVKFEKAELKNSIYSFNFVSPENRLGKDTIIETSFPGLMELEQLDAGNRVAHVKLGNAGTAKMTLSAVGACRGVSQDWDGQFVFNSSKADDVFVANRTYSIDRRFSNGYRASMNLDSVKEQIAKQVITHTNSGFRKDQAFEDKMVNELDSMMSFTWTEELSETDDSQSLEELMQIRQSVFAFWIDQYFDALMSNDRLVKLDPAKVEPAQGGMVTSTHVGHRCWTKKFLFYRRTRCGNYTYQVKNWRNGITTQEIKKSLDVGFTGVDEMKVNKMVPFYYTSTFEN